MPIINKVPNKKISINLQGAISIPSTDANILLIGHRAGAIASYSQLRPKPGYPQLTAYRSYDLPNFNSGDAALSYMQSLGFNVGYGLSNELLFIAPSQIIPPPNGPLPSGELLTNKTKVKKQPLQDNATTTTLQWDSAPISFETLIGSPKTINITQINGGHAAIATVQAVSLNPCQLILINVQGTFTTNAQIMASYIDAKSTVPDPARTDEICMMVYSAFNSINTKFPQTINTITPTISICFLNPTDPGFQPNGSTIPYYQDSNLTKAALSAVQKLPNGNTGIYFANLPSNFGYTPLISLGNTLISKDSSNYGTLVQVLSGVTPSGVGIELTNLTGSFAVGDEVNFAMDATQDVFSLLTSPKEYPVSPYEIATQADISSPTSKFIPFFNYLAKANAPTSVNDGSFFAIGVVSNLSIPKQQASSLPVFDPSTFGAEYITGAYYPYTSKFGDYQICPAMVASSYAGIIACNDVPFNPLNNVLLKLPVPADLSTVLNDLSSITTAINLGWTPIGVNSRQQAYIVRAVTGLLYLPGTETPDTEYFPVTDWQIIGLWKKAVFQVLGLPQFTNKRKSPKLKDSVVNALQPLALNFDDKEMFYNMAKLVGEFEVVDDDQDPAKYKVITPVCVTPEFNSIEVMVNVLSYLSQVTTTA